MAEHFAAESCDTYELSGVRFTSWSREKRPLADADFLECKLQLIPGEHVQEVVWDKHYLLIEHLADGVKLFFDPELCIEGSLLRRWQGECDPVHNQCKCPVATHELVSLPFAETWRAQVPTGDVADPSKDWTHSSTFKGLITTSCNGIPQLPGVKLAPTEGYMELRRELLSPDETMPMSLLRDTSLPILYYQEIPFTEDDLNDCGLENTSIRLRVMPTFYYLCLKQHMRVDSVIDRERDIRIFHEFGTNELLREVIHIDRKHLLAKISPMENPAAGHFVGETLASYKSTEKISWKPRQ